MPDGHALICPTCGADIAAENVELSLMIAKCSSCDAVFGFAEQVGHSEQEVIERALGGGDRRSQPPIPSDHRVTELDTGDQLVLSMGWFSPQTLFIALFALVWNGFLLVWYSIGLAGLLAGETEMILMLLFPVLHVAVGAYVGYTALTGFLNSTTVTVDRTGIDVRHGPLPWPGNVTLAANDVDQLYVSPRVVRSKKSQRTVYDVKAVSKGGTEMAVLRSLEDDRAALFMERRVEQWLGIAERRIPGQHG